MKYMMSLVLMLCISGQMFGQVKVDSPASFERDSRIRLDISGLDGLQYRTKWWVRSDDGRNPPDHDVFNNGATCAIWAGPGRYEALITVAVIEGNEISWFDIEHKFRVVGDVPDDEPDEPIDPPNHDYDFGDVVGHIADLAKPVTDPSNKAEAAKIIADAYREHGLRAVKGDYKNQNDLADATASEYVAQLGLNRYVRWRPMMTRVRQHMQSLMNDGKLKSGDMAAWGALWEEYARGFDRVAKSQGATR